MLYDKVLSEDPSNPNALANAGFIQWNVGSTAQVASLVRVGRAEIRTAIRDSPTYYQAHLYEGLVLENQDHDHAAAVAQFNQFLADLPSATANWHRPRRSSRGVRRSAGPRAGTSRRRPVPGEHNPVRFVAPAVLHQPETPGERRPVLVGGRPADADPERVTGSTPMASSTGDGAMLSDEQAEPECTATPARSSPMSTGSASTPATPRQTRWGSRSSAPGPTTSTPSTASAAAAGAELPPRRGCLLGRARRPSGPQRRRRRRGAPEAPRARPGARAPARRRRGAGQAGPRAGRPAPRPRAPRRACAR